MTVNEAKKLVEAEYPNLKAAYAIPNKGKYVFNMVNKKTGKPVFNSCLYVVDENTGKVSSVSIFSSDLEEIPEDEVKKNIVYFCKEGMDMMNMKVI